MKRVLVIGDSCTDEFVYGQCKRLSPEGPVPVFIPIRRVTNRGMAGNVAANLESLGCKVVLITNTEEIVKTRYVEQDSNHLIVRVDIGDKVNQINVDIRYDEFDAVIISDYDKGFLTYNSILDILNQCFNRGLPIFLDTKRKITNDICNLVSYIKINKVEFENNSIVLKRHTDKVIVTLGSNGAKYNGDIYQVDKVEIKDISGAGDTFLSGLVVGYLKSNSISDGIQFANKCATKVVQKIGVSVI